MNNEYTTLNSNCLKYNPDHYAGTNTPKSNSITSTYFTSSNSPFQVPGWGEIIEVGDKDSTWHSQIAMRRNCGLWYRWKENSNNYTQWVNPYEGLNVKDLLWDGSSSYTLSHPYTDYTYLLVVGYANANKTTMFIPVEEIESRFYFDLTILGASTAGKVSSFTFSTSIFIKFNTTTTFTVTEHHFDNNFIGTIHKIYGIGKPLGNVTV